MASSTAPGRLGNPSMSLSTDPRLHPKLREALGAYGIDQFVSGTDIPDTTSFEALNAIAAQTDAAAEGLYEALPNDLPSDAEEPEVVQSTTVVPGPDGNDIALHTFRRADAEGNARPGVVYFHGGGMVALRTLNKVHIRWLTSLALAGVVAIAVDFRNAYTKDRYNPFPAGLNDCAAAVQYIAAHKPNFGISTLVLQGESGGGNLVLATALKANKEGWIGQIDGVYASVPAIATNPSQPREELVRELPSSAENDGYMLNMRALRLMAVYYTPSLADQTDPLAWPYYAQIGDMAGLPPHRLVMDELDPLRDGGVAYARKLAGAGVDVTALVQLGTTHGASLLFRQALPALHQEAVDAIVAFARRL